MKPPRPLTERQRQIVAAIGRGLTFEEVGRELGISAGRARNSAREAAMKLPNPGGLPPKAQIKLYVAWRQQKAS